QAEKDDVIVAVDDARHRGAPAEVDLAHAIVVAIVGAVADGCEAAVPYEDRRHDAVLGVHRVDPAVHHSHRLVAPAPLIVAVVVRPGLRSGQCGGQRAGGERDEARTHPQIDAHDRPLPPKNDDPIYTRSPTKTEAPFLRVLLAAWEEFLTLRVRRRARGIP